VRSISPAIRFSELRIFLWIEFPDDLDITLAELEKLDLL
jgi:hypothetical protein